MYCLYRHPAILSYNPLFVEFRQYLLRITTLIPSKLRQFFRFTFSIVECHGILGSVVRKGFSLKQLIYSFGSGFIGFKNGLLTH